MAFPDASGRVGESLAYGGGVTPRVTEQPSVPDCRVLLAVPVDAAGTALLVDAAEHARIDQIRDHDTRRATLTAHALLRMALASQLGRRAASITLLRRCRTCGSDAHGAPHLGVAGLPAISLSHTDGLVAVAITDAARVGVDVESLRGVDVAALAGQVWGRGERRASRMGRSASLQGRDEFFAAWVAKEAVLKARGDGLAVPMTGIDVSRDRVDDPVAGTLDLTRFGTPTHAGCVAVPAGVRVDVGLADGELADAVRQAEERRDLSR